MVPGFDTPITFMYEIIIRVHVRGPGYAFEVNGIIHTKVTCLTRRFGCEGSVVSFNHITGQHNNITRPITPFRGTTTSKVPIHALRDRVFPRGEERIEVNLQLLALTANFRQKRHSSRQVSLCLLAATL